MPGNRKLPRLDELLGKLDPKHRDAIIAGLRAGEHAIARARARLRVALVPKPPEEKRGSAVLHLVLAASRWEAAVDGPDLPEPQFFGEDCAFASEEGPLQPEALARRAIAALPEALRASIGRVVLASADPGFAFADNRGLRIPDGDPEETRTVAAQQFGGTAAAFGFVPFGDSSEREQERRLYAFAQSDRLRSYLYGLDKLALSLNALVPLSALALKAAAPEAGGPADPYAVLYVGDYFSQAFVANPETGAVAASTIGVGALSLAAAIAAEMGLSLRQAAQGMARRDRICQLAPGKADATTAAQTTIGSLIAPPLYQLGEALNELIEYFVHQRLAGDPQRLVVCGEADRLPGLAPWLSAASGLTVETLPFAWHEILKQPDLPKPNLLEGAENGLLTIGKTVYRFRNSQFVPEQPELLPAASLSAGKPAKAKTPTGKLGQMLQQIRWLNLPEIKYFAGFAALVVALAFLDLHAFVYPPADAVRGNAASYADLIRQNERIEAKRVADMEGEAQDLAAILDPGSWAERLVAVAHHIGPSISLRRVRLVDSGRGRRGSQPQLVLEARLPRQGDYLGTIGALVEALNGDEAFMRGLASLGFEGAKLAGDDPAFVEFALTASYGGSPHPSNH